MYQCGRTAALCRAPILAGFHLSLPASFSPATLGFPAPPGPAIQLHQSRGSATTRSRLVPETSPDIKANPNMEVGEEKDQQDSDPLAPYAQLAG